MNEKEYSIPKVSIITVTYNCINDIEETIKSILQQDYPNLEYIIIDGKSTDGTVELINQYRNKIDRIISESDKGIYDAMNKGLMKATGDWIAFMNAGDRYFSKDTISALFLGVTTKTKLKVIYGNTKYLHNDNTYSNHNTVDIQRLKWGINRYQPYTHQAVFYNIKNKLDCIYNTNYKIAADYDVACRYWNKYGVEAYKFVPITVCEYKAYDGLSSNPKNLIKIYKEKIKVKIGNKMSLIEILKDVVAFIKLSIEQK